MKIGKTPKTGGEYLQKHNRDILKTLFDDVNIVEIPKISVFKHLVNFLLIRSYGFSNTLKVIIDKAIRDKYAIAFLDSSAYGGYVKYFQKKGLKTVVFCHNVEYVYYREKFESNNNPINWVLLHYIHYQEHLSMRYASKVIALNKRDFKGINSYYKRNADMIIPVYHDKIEESELMLKETGSRYLLFVGANFYANNEGIGWFIREVSPFINITIYIAGGCCEYIRKTLDVSMYANVTLLGFVSDLDSLYKNAYGVIGPIFKGSGMKTKTIEALKYGKSIFATSEAFEGIDADFKRIGGLCNTAKEFINAINNTSLHQFNKYSYDTFLEKYSTEAVIPMFEKIMSEIE